MPVRPFIPWKTYHARESRSAAGPVETYCQKVRAQAHPDFPVAVFGTDRGQLASFSRAQRARNQKFRRSIHSRIVQAGTGLLRAAMSPPDAPPHVQDRIAELREQIQRHNQLYYDLGEPEISDSEYDKLFKELQNLEEQYPDLLTPESPTQRVGAVRRERFEHFSKVPHDRPLLSLDSVLVPDEVQAFDNRVKKELDLDRIEYVVEPKYDGL